MSLEEPETRDRRHPNERDEEQSEARPRANGLVHNGDERADGLQPGSHGVSSSPLRQAGKEEVPAVSLAPGGRSGQDGDFLPLDEAEVDDGAEPGALEGVD